MRSTVGSNTSNSRTRHNSNVNSTIQMEPGLQALLIAEGRAASMIAIARSKRNELLRKSYRESQIEIEAFRQEREAQYKKKLNEATKLEQYQATFDKNRNDLLETMDRDVQRKRKFLVDYIIDCVIDGIVVKPHPNTKRIIS